MLGPANWYAFRQGGGQYLFESSNSSLGLKQKCVACRT